MQEVLLSRSIPLSMHHAELALRMVAGTVLGGLIGWERNVEDRHFGLRIHMLTSLAAAGFSVAALEAVDWARLQNIAATPIAPASHRPTPIVRPFTWPSPLMIVPAASKATPETTASRMRNGSASTTLVCGPIPNEVGLR